MTTQKNVPEIEISIRYKNKVSRSELITITNSQQIADICRKLHNSETIDWIEEVILLCLNRANKIIGYYKVSQGGVTGTVLDTKVIFIPGYHDFGKDMLSEKHQIWFTWLKKQLENLNIHVN